jgi:hypothetical protein
MQNGRTHISKHISTTKKEPKFQSFIRSIWVQKTSPIKTSEFFHLISFVSWYDLDHWEKLNLYILKKIFRAAENFWLDNKDPGFDKICAGYPTGRTLELKKIKLSQRLFKTKSLKL